MHDNEPVWLFFCSNIHKKKYGHQKKNMVIKSQNMFIGHAR